jgi:hypothetical protein
MDPFWQEVNDSGDIATIDESGIIQIGSEEEEVCQGAWPPWLIYWACDECGCSQGTIWLEDCSADCCVTPCDPVPTVTGSSTTTTSSTEQYTYNDGQGSVVWSVTGTGASIDQTGLLTTSGSACGMLEVKATDDCCGEFTLDVRVTDNGSWVLVAEGLCRARYLDKCINCDWIVGQYRYTIECVSSDFGDPTPMAPCAQQNCTPYGGATWHGDYKKQYLWTC